ncbi:MAG TPA: thioredoxin family protein [Micropepsaceae bacterium]|nr:thioredoxin family protein [Micropepsaceae bacterium]
MRHKLFAVIAAAAFGIGLPVCAGAATAPRTTVTSMAQLPGPLPYPYTENADAKLAVSQAFARAKTSGKRVLIEFGGNWCPDCRILAGVMQLPEVQSFVASHYETATVDVGRFDRNLDVVSKFGIAKLQGVPTVVIADADGKPVNVTNSADLDNAREMTPQGIADWLARWADGP